MGMGALEDAGNGAPQQPWPGLQAHGAVLVLDEQSLEVLAASDGWMDHLRGLVTTSAFADVKESRGILGRSLQDLVDSEVLAEIKVLIRRALTHGPSMCELAATGWAGRPLRGSCSRPSKGRVVFTFKPTEPDGQASGACMTSLPCHQLARKAIDRLQAAPTRDVLWFCNAAVEEFQNLTGYERVIIGRCIDDNMAEIVAESCVVRNGNVKSDVPSLISQFFPTPTMPQEWLHEGAKHQLPLRFIKDVGAKQQDILLRASESEGALREAVLAESPLAGVDPQQRQLLQALGVRSLLLIPLIFTVSGQTRIWGFIIFHQFGASAASLSYELRDACTFIVQALRSHLITSIKAHERREERKMSSLQSTICERLTYHDPSALVLQNPSIQSLIPCDGAAHLCNKTVVKAGACPHDFQVRELVRWARARVPPGGDTHVIASSSLEEDGFLYKAFLPLPEGAEGEEPKEGKVVGAALVALLSPSDAFVWFRTKSLGPISWAWTEAAASGGPVALLAGGKTAQALRPPKQEIWRAPPWTHVQLAAVQGLQKLVQEALRGNSEAVKTRFLVRLNEERLRAMQDLALVARNLRHLMDIATTPILGVNHKLEISEWNLRIAKLTGRSKSSVMGLPLKDVVAPQSLAAAKEKLEQVLEGKSQDYFELTLQCNLPEGAVKPEEAEAAQQSGEVEKVIILMATLTPQLDSSNDVIGVGIIGLDVTEQREMMRKCEIEGGAEEYQFILDKATMPIWGVDRDGQIVEWNSAMVKACGVSREQAVGKRLVGEILGQEKKIMVPEKDTLLALEFAIQRALAGHETPPVSFGFVNDRGRSVEAVLNIQQRKDWTSGSTQVMCFMEDVTMRRAMEKAMAVRVAAEAAEHAKSRHLAFLCHEIRNPLNGILGNITFMEDTSLSEEQRELVETTATCGHQLRRIVEDVLDITQVEEGKVLLERDELHLQRIVNAVISQVGIAAAKKGLQLCSSIEARCHSWTPLGDAPRLQQILSNFAWNAVKFTQQGWVEIGIGMEEPRQSNGKHVGRYHFCVSDSGEGIPESLRLRLFEKFTTGRKVAASQYGGTGLGLSICQQLAALMGGEVRCQSEVGKGSTFSLEVDLEILPRPLHKQKQQQQEEQQRKQQEQKDQLLLQNDKGPPGGLSSIAANSRPGGFSGGLAQQQGTVEESLPSGLPSPHWQWEAPVGSIENGTSSSTPAEAESEGQFAVAGRGHLEAVPGSVVLSDAPMVQGADATFRGSFRDQNRTTARSESANFLPSQSGVVSQAPSAWAASPLATAPSVPSLPPVSPSVPTGASLASDPRGTARSSGGGRGLGPSGSLSSMSSNSSVYSREGLFKGVSAGSEEYLSVPSSLSTLSSDSAASAIASAQGETAATRTNEVHRQKRDGSSPQDLPGGPLRGDETGGGAPALPSKGIPLSLAEAASTTAQECAPPESERAFAPLDTLASGSGPPSFSMQAEAENGGLGVRVSLAPPPTNKIMPRSQAERGAPSRMDASRLTGTAPAAPAPTRSATAGGYSPELPPLISREDSWGEEGGSLPTRAAAHAFGLAPRGEPSAKEQPAAAQVQSQRRGEGRNPQQQQSIAGLQTLQQPEPPCQQHPQNEGGSDNLSTVLSLLHVQEAGSLGAADRPESAPNGADLLAPSPSMANAKGPFSSGPSPLLLSPPGLLSAGRRGDAAALPVGPSPATGIITPAAVSAGGSLLAAATAASASTPPPGGVVAAPSMPPPARGLGPVQPTPGVPTGDIASVSLVAAKLTLTYGNEWSFRVLRELLLPTAVAVLVEVDVRGRLRQQWGSVPCDPSTPVITLLPLATAAAFTAAAELFPPLPPSDGLSSYAPVSAPPASSLQGSLLHQQVLASPTFAVPAWPSAGPHSPLDLIAVPPLPQRITPGLPLPLSTAPLPSWSGKPIHISAGQPLQPSAGSRPVISGDLFSPLNPAAGPSGSVASSLPGASAPPPHVLTSPSLPDSSQMSSSTNSRGELPLLFGTFSSTSSNVSQALHPPSRSPAYPGTNPLMSMAPGALLGGPPQQHSLVFGSPLEPGSEASSLGPGEAASADAAAQTVNGLRGTSLLGSDGAAIDSRKSRFHRGSSDVSRSPAGASSDAWKSRFGRSSSTRVEASLPGSGGRLISQASVPTGLSAPAPVRDSQKLAEAHAALSSGGPVLASKMPSAVAQYRAMKSASAPSTAATSRSQSPLGSPASVASLDHGMNGRATSPTVGAARGPADVATKGEVRGGGEEDIRLPKSPIAAPEFFRTSELASPEDSNRPQVLVVDDEPVNVRVVKKALDRAHFRVTTGSDGTDVVEMVCNLNQRFDALLLDENLKVMNGSEACFRVREYETSKGLPEMPIVAISANVEPDDLKKYAIAGYSAVLGKPINVRTLGERLSRFLETYRQCPAERRAELTRGNPVKIKRVEELILFS
eukprot:TRINITY_DN5233_c0_g1_i1.p1 TRINITY_DN5233_c0_g1~~TRINITY_DN5233_c0_g1_i1.p1  ORF type:complete len:2421 (+),score=516.47 TRINITY_DN5233_c0_g1_i1:176-7438(+)